MSIARTTNLEKRVNALSELACRRQKRIADLEEQTHQRLVAINELRERAVKSEKRAAKLEKRVAELEKGAVELELEAYDLPVLENTLTPCDHMPEFRFERGDFAYCHACNRRLDPASGETYTAGGRAYHFKTTASGAHEAADATAGPPRLWHCWKCDTFTEAPA